MQVVRIEVKFIHLTLNLLSAISVTSQRILSFFSLLRDWSILMPCSGLSSTRYTSLLLLLVPAPLVPVVGPSDSAITAAAGGHFPPAGAVSYTTLHATCNM